MSVSEKSHAELEKASRNRKAKKIISVLDRFANLEDCVVLDIGTGSGHIAHMLSKRCKSVTSLDLNDERIDKSGYKFKKAEDERIPLMDKSFDIVISNHVIEHVPNQELHISEIYRVLKTSGWLYLATPNKYWVNEPHYNLPLLSWFPRRISALYLKVIKNKSWDVYPLSYLGLKKLAKGRFAVRNLTLDILKNPKKYNLDIFKPLQPLARITPLFVLKLLNPVMPSYILLLRKKQV